MKRWLYILAALALTACSLEPREIQVTDDEFARNAYTPPVGIQTFRQVLASRAVISGHRPADGDAVMTVYDASSNLFSMDGDGLTVSSPMVLALGSLSAAFCDRAFESDSMTGDGARALYRHVPVGQSPGAFSPANRKKFATHLFRRALQRDPAAAETAVVTKLLDQAFSGGAPLREGVVAACAAVLSSLESWAQ